jgi:DNA end-binding protein Ku
VRYARPKDHADKVVISMLESVAAIDRLDESANDQSKPVKTTKPKKPKPKVEGQREMLLPIAGGKAEAEAKPAKASTPRRKAG